MPKVSLPNRILMTPRPTAFVWIALSAALIASSILLGSFVSPHVEHVLKEMDFTNYWVASKLIIDGRVTELFSGQDVYFAALRQYAGFDISWHNWSYPPHYLLFILPFGFFSCISAAAAFLSATLVLFLHAVSRTAAGSRQPNLFFLLLLPTIICNIAFMQNGFLTSALLIYGLTLRESRPVISGIAIGMLTIKPQLGFLLPILLIFERRWIVIFSATATAALMIGLSILAWGLQPWIGYLTLNLPYQKTVMLNLGGLFTAMMPSLYGSMRTISVQSGLALKLHLVVAILAFGGYGFCLLKARTHQVRAAITMFATFVISPYSLVYDLGSLTVFAALGFVTAIRSAEIDRKVGLFWLFPLIGVCFLPFLTTAFAAIDFPISPVIIVLGWIGVMTICRQGRPIPDK